MVSRRHTYERVRGAEGRMCANFECEKGRRPGVYRRGVEMDDVWEWGSVLIISLLPPYQMYEMYQIYCIKYSRLQAATLETFVFMHQFTQFTPIPILPIPIHRPI